MRELLTLVRQHRANHYAWTLTNLRDDNDRLFLWEECRNNLTGRQATDDACCDNVDLSAH